MSALPDAIDGALIANEVLDAVAPHVIARRGGKYFERGVTWDDAQSQFAWAERPAGSRLATLAAMRFPEGVDYVSEINPAAEALVETIGTRIVAGAALFLDYGFPAAEYYHPQRSEGTLMCHYRHRAHGNPFVWPGLTDITAHVDFSAMAAAGERGGLDVAGFTAQAPFLLGCGILEALSATGAPETLDYIRAAASVQKLARAVRDGRALQGPGACADQNDCVARIRNERSAASVVTMRLEARGASGRSRLQTRSRDVGG